MSNIKHALTNNKYMFDTLLDFNEINLFIQIRDTCAKLLQQCQTLKC